VMFGLQRANIPG